MIKKKSFSCVCILGCMTLLFFTGAFAAPRLALRKGMPLDEIVKVWGAPSNKIVKETKRESIYEYPGASLLLRDGKLVSWKLTDERLAFDPEQQSSPIEPVIRDIGERSAVESILTEIISESSSETLSSQSKVPGSAGINP